MVSCGLRAGAGSASRHTRGHTHGWAVSVGSAGWCGAQLRSELTFAASARLQLFGPAHPPVFFFSTLARGKLHQQAFFAEDIRMPGPRGWVIGVSGCLSWRLVTFLSRATTRDIEMKRSATTRGRAGFIPWRRARRKNEQSETWFLVA